MIQKVSHADTFVPTAFNKMVKLTHIPNKIVETRVKS